MWDNRGWKGKVNMVQNCHYVPRQVLRRYGDRIDLFNVRTQEYVNQAKIEKVYSQKNLGPSSARNCGIQYAIR